MDTLSYKTISANPKIVKRNWYLVDAENQIVGRISSQIAHILRGKNKPYYTPHFDTGDYVVIINADKVRFTGNKFTDKQYLRHTGYPGGQRVSTPKSLFVADKHERVLENAISKMLPKNKLGNAMVKKLFVYKGATHPHTAQEPTPLVF